MQVSLKKSVTLVELLVSITLMGIVILGAVAFHLAGERFLTSSEAKTYVLNDLAFVLEHLQKNILIAEGFAGNPGIIVDVNVLTLIQETRTVEYNFDTGNNNIAFRIDTGTGFGAWENLTLSFIDLAGSGWPFSIACNPNDGGVEIINLALRLDPGSAENDSINPQVTTIDTGASNRTIYFYSLAHTW